MRYGIPNFKLEKTILDRRLEQMQLEGVTFVTGAHVGQNVPVEDLQRDFDAILLSGGAEQPRDLSVPGRELKGIHFAMDYLPQQNHRCEGDVVSEAGPSWRRAREWSSSEAGTRVRIAWEQAIARRLSRSSNLKSCRYRRPPAPLLHLGLYGRCSFALKGHMKRAESGTGV